MSYSKARTVPISVDLAGFYRLTVVQYRQMIDAGILSTDEPIELLDGLLVNQPRPLSPKASFIRTRIIYKFAHLEFTGWWFHGPTAITLEISEPEPDFAVVRGAIETHDKRFPHASEVGIVGEVSESSLAFDRIEKGRIYARAGIPIFWIINVEDKQIEVYSDPDPAANPPEYRARQDYRPGDTLPISLDGNVVASIPAADLLP